MPKARFTFVIFIGLAILIGATEAGADSNADFYQDKTISVTIGYEAGGGYDQYARLFARYAGRHIPGEPSLVPRNMPGGGSLRAANYLFNAAPRDGTVLGMFGQNLPMYQATSGENVEYDARRFNWIGNMGAEVNVITAWHTAGIQTIQDVMERELPVGATGVSSTSVLFPTLMNNVLGTKFRIITGYPGGQSISLAIERGEVGGRGSESWSALHSLHKDWLEQKKIYVLVQIGLRREPAISHVPLMTELAKSDEDRQILELFSSATAIGRPIVAPPDVPEDRISILRKAFDALMQQKDFRTEADKARIEINPVSGEELQQIVAKIVNAPKEVIAKAKEAQKPRGLIEQGKK